MLRIHMLRNLIISLQRLWGSGRETINICPLQSKIRKTGSGRPFPELQGIHPTFLARTLISMATWDRVTDKLASGSIWGCPRDRVLTSRPRTVRLIRSTSDKVWKNLWIWDLMKFCITRTRSTISSSSFFRSRLARFFHLRSRTSRSNSTNRSTSRKSRPNPTWLRIRFPSRFQDQKISPQQKLTTTCELP